MRPCVLSIAGYDPCGGAGVLADVKTFEQSGCMGLAVITGLTYQHESRIDRIDWRNTKDIIQELKVLAEKYEPKALKFGLVKDEAMLRELISEVKHLWPEVKIVLDPIFKASSGEKFHSSYSESMMNYIEFNVYVITPNAKEYNELNNVEKFNLVTVITGKLAENKVIDTLITPEGETQFESARNELEKHGSGCVFSARLTAALAQGYGISDGVELARDYVHRFRLSDVGLLGYHT